MARTQTTTKRRRKTAKAQRRRVPLSIAHIIGMLTKRYQRHDLCLRGQERLRWWRRHGHRFRDAKAAIATWSSVDIERYADYLNLRYPSRFTNASPLNSTQYYVQQAIANLPTTPRHKAIARMLRDVDTAVDQVRVNPAFTRWFQRTTVDDWYLDPADW